MEAMAWRCHACRQIVRPDLFRSSRRSITSATSANLSRTSLRQDGLGRHPLGSSSSTSVLKFVTQFRSSRKTLYTPLPSTATSIHHFSTSPPRHQSQAPSPQQRWEPHNIQTSTQPPPPPSPSSHEAQPAPEPPAQSPPAPLKIHNPRHSPSGEPLLLTPTPRAIAQLTRLAHTEANPSLSLRVSVSSGGCHGFQYQLSLLTSASEISAEEDTVFESEEGARIVADEASLELLAGAKVDYAMELIGSQFKVTGIPGATSSCGCGSSFDVGG